VARTRDRQRALARAKLDRQIARRAAAARKKRQIQAGTAAGLALVLIVLGALWFSGVFEPDKEKPVGSGQCAWNSTEGGESTKDVGRPPTKGIQTSGVETMTITTNQGVIKAVIDTAKVPCAAASFSFLSSKGYFDNTPCHRLTTDGGGYVLQCGDPSGTGSGGPGYRYADENLPEPLPSSSASPSADPSASASAATTGPAIYTRGMIAMANSGDDTNGSQFFIVYKDSPAFQAKYTILGTVTEGLEVVDKIAAGGVAEGGSSPSDGKPKLEVTVQSLTLTGADTPAGTPSSEPASPGSGSPSASTQ
jgi:peptidyl-prolyl cis-trans isomerase B (cyclophilin B)